MSEVINIVLLLGISSFLVFFHDVFTTQEELIMNARGIVRDDQIDLNLVNVLTNWKEQFR